LRYIKRIYKRLPRLPPPESDEEQTSDSESEQTSESESEQTSESESEQESSSSYSSSSSSSSSEAHPQEAPGGVPNSRDSSNFRYIELPALPDSDNESERVLAAAAPLPLTSPSSSTSPSTSTLASASNPHLQTPRPSPPPPSLASPRRVIKRRYSLNDQRLCKSARGFDLFGSDNKDCLVPENGTPFKRRKKSGQQHSTPSKSPLLEVEERKDTKAGDSVNEEKEKQNPNKPRKRDDNDPDTDSNGPPGALRTEQQPVEQPRQKTEQQQGEVGDSRDSAAGEDDQVPDIKEVETQNITVKENPPKSDLKVIVQKEKLILEIVNVGNEVFKLASVAFNKKSSFFPTIPEKNISLESKLDLVTRGILKVKESFGPAYLARRNLIEQNFSSEVVAPTVLEYLNTDIIRKLISKIKEADRLLGKARLLGKENQGYQQKQPQQVQEQQDQQEQQEQQDLLQQQNQQQNQEQLQQQQELHHEQQLQQQQELHHEQQLQQQQELHEFRRRVTP